MGTCKTCKHWGNVAFDWDRTVYCWPVGDGPSVEEAVRHKPCGSPGIVDACKMRVADADYARNRLPLDVAYFHDYEGYKADFRTGPGFGCIHHAAEGDGNG